MAVVVDRARDQWAAVFTHSVIVLAGPSVFPPQTSHKLATESSFIKKFAWNLQVDETELGSRSCFFRRTHGNEGIRRIRRLGVALPENLDMARFKMKRLLFF